MGRKRWRGISLPARAPLRWGNKLSDDFGPHDNFSIEFHNPSMGHIISSLPSLYHFFWPYHAWDLSSLTRVEPITLLWKSENEVAQSCPALCDPMDSTLPGSSAHEIFQARVVEWAATSFSRGCSQPRDRTWVSCIADRCFTTWATREALLWRGVALSHWIAREVPLPLLTVFLHPWPSFTLSAGIQEEFGFPNQV